MVRASLCNGGDQSNARPRRHQALIVALAIAACGGSSKPQPTPPPPPDPVPMPEPVATEPAEPPPDAQPAEPQVPPPDPKAELVAAERAAYDKAKPVFDKWCAKCHAKGGKLATEKKLGHFDMTDYPFKGHHETEIGKTIRKSLGIDGSKPTMPFDKKGAVKGDELAAIEAWSKAFDASHEGGAHTHHHH